MPHIVDLSASVSARTVRQNFKSPVLPLERNSYGHSSADSLRERPISKRSLRKMDGDKVLVWEVLPSAPSTRTLPIRMRTISKIGRKKKNPKPMWRRVPKRVVLEKPTQFLNPVDLGCTQRGCEPKPRIVSRTPELVRTLDLSWYGRTWLTFEEVCGNVLRVGKNKTSSYCSKFPHFTLRRPLVQRIGIGNGGRNIKSFFSEVPKCLYPARIGRSDTLWKFFLGKINHQVEQSV